MPVITEKQAEEWRRSAEKASRATLGLPNDVALTEEVIQDAFRDRIRAIHPDGSGMPTDDAADEIWKAKKARSFLMKMVEIGQDCSDCDGTGQVQKQTGAFRTAKICKACDGTGSL